MVAMLAACSSGSDDAAPTTAIEATSTTSAPSTTLPAELSADTRVAVSACVETIRDDNGAAIAVDELARAEAIAEVVEPCVDARALVAAELGAGSKLASELGLISGIYNAHSLGRQDELPAALGVWIKGVGDLAG